jgi:electron transport complex protein RnfD
MGSQNEKKLVSMPMPKDQWMKYTLIALSIIAVTSIVGFGITALILVLVSVAVAVACDYAVVLASRKKSPSNLYSAAVAGMIVALSFSSGLPYSSATSVLMDIYVQIGAVVVISAVTVIVFKRIQGLLGRKFVNPAAAAKLLVLAPIYAIALIPEDHLLDIATGSGLRFAVSEMCYAYHPPVGGISFTSFFSDPVMSLVILKTHGWIGGASSIAVIAVGIGLILLSKGYFKWRIPLTYLATIAVISAGYGLINGEDVVLRMAFHLFIGSVIFLAFFMATDPATSPLTGVGQLIFAVGLGILTFVIQLYMQFLGGSILALVIMNMTTPLLDRIGLPKPNETRASRKLPKAKKFENPPLTNCIRCGKCLQICCKFLSPILIKEAADKSNWERVKILKADYCEGCGHCTYVCPSRIDLKTAVLDAKKKILAA